MNVVKKENLCVVVRTYQDKDGQNKNVYKTIGELTTIDDGKGGQFQVGELYHMPGQTIKIFQQDNQPNQQPK
jgi:hypothetical protein